MAIFTTEEQVSAYAKDPDFYRGPGFMLGLMGYKKNGQKSLFGKIKDVALPVIGGIAGTVIGGPAGTMIGSAIGQGLNAASNRAAAGIVGAAEDSEAAIDDDLTGTMARGQLGMGLAGLAGTATSGIQAGSSVQTIMKSLGDVAGKNMPGLASGVAGAITADGMVSRPKNTRIRYFRQGGESKASPGFAARFAMERAAQGAGGEFEYRGKRYNTYFKEEVDERGRPLTTVGDAAPERITPGMAGRMMPESSPVDESRDDLVNVVRKSGVRTAGVNPVLAGYINNLPAHLRRAVMITSGMDSFGVHAPKSRHRYGKALDLRFNPELYDYIRKDPEAKRIGLRTIDPNHGTAPHIHLEYQFKEGGETPSFEPLTPKPFRMSGTKMRQARMLRAGTDRVEEDMFHLGLDQKYGKLPAYVAQDDTQLQETLKASTGGVDYVRNWVAGQAKLGNMGMTDRHATMGQSLKDPVVTSSASLAERMGANPDESFIQGLYDPSVDTVNISRGLDNPTARTVATHESTHQLQNRMGDFSRKLSILDPSLQATYDNIEQGLKVSNRPALSDTQRNEYLRKPHEIHARIMQLRMEMGLTPDKVHKPSKFRQQLNTESNAYQELKEVLTDDEIYNLMDPKKTVSNDRGRSAPTMFAAKDGGETQTRFGVKGEKRKPLVYTYAGLNFTIDQPTDYKVYDKDDTTEDIVMSVPDGEEQLPYGAMRFGERILDQHANLAAKAIMASGVSKVKKRAALGELLHEELQSHSDTDTDYAKGGEVLPTRYLRRFAGGDATDPPAGEFIDIGGGKFIGRGNHNGPVAVYVRTPSGKLQPTPERINATNGVINLASGIQLNTGTGKGVSAGQSAPINFDVVSGTVASGAKPAPGRTAAPMGNTRDELLSTIDRLEKEQTTFQQQEASAASAKGRQQQSAEVEANQRYKLTERTKRINEARQVLKSVHVGGYQPLLGESNEDKLARARRLLESADRDFGTPQPTAPAPATTGSGVRTPAPIVPAVNPVPATTAPPTVPSRVARAAGVGRPATVTPKPTAVPTTALTKMALGDVKTIVRDADDMLTRPIVDLATGNAKKAAGPMMDKVPALDAALAKQMGTGTGATTTTTADSPFNVGNLLDLSRVATGAIMAAKKIEPYQVPAELQTAQSEAIARKNEGYSSEEWNTINGQIGDTYNAGVNALTNMTGAGANAGVVLAGLSRLGQQRGQQTQTAIVGDVAQRQRNRGIYGNVIGQMAALDRQNYDERVDQVNQSRQAGAGLVSASLNNIEQRGIYNKAYGPGSLYSKIAEMELAKGQQAVEMLKKIKANNVAAGKQ